MVSIEKISESAFGILFRINGRLRWVSYERLIEIQMETEEEIK